MKSLEFFIDKPSGPGVDSAYNGNEDQKYFLGGKDGQCVRMTILPPSRVDCLETGSLNLREPSGPVQACIGFTFTFTVHSGDTEGLK